MRTRGIAITVALLLALAATAAVFAYLRGATRTASGTPANMVTVIVSKQSIPAGTQLDALISQGDFTTLQVPSDAVVPGAITQLAQLKDKTTNSFILANEQISTARLEGSSQPTGGVLGIPAGYQALTVSLQTPQVVGGVIQGGDHVVIYATITPPNSKGGQETITVVPDVQILKVVASSSSGPAGTTSGPTLVTLALRPTDVARVVLAQQQGTVYLSLLPPSQHGVLVGPVTLAGLGR